MGGVQHLPHDQRGQGPDCLNRQRLLGTWVGYKVVVWPTQELQKVAVTVC